jgi:hypothetical protein
MSITTAGRTISADMVTEVTTAQLSPILMASLDFSTPLYLWTGYGTLTYNGVGYLGLGTLGTISPVQETTDLAARGITMQLSGVPTAMVYDALTEDYQGRACSIMFGALSTTAGLVASPITIFSGRMDVMQISDDGQSSQITMTAENKLIDFKRTREVRYTNEDQQTLFPTYASITLPDLGLEFVNAIQEKTIYWGNQNATNASNWNGGGETGDNNGTEQ